MNRLPSTSYSMAPFARLMKSGWPPTDRKARTGLLTPPGMRRWACSNSRCERVVFMKGATLTRKVRNGQDSGERSLKLTGRTFPDTAEVQLDTSGHGAYQAPLSSILKFLAQAGGDRRLRFCWLCFRNTGLVRLHHLAFSDGPVTVARLAKEEPCDMSTKSLSRMCPPCEPSMAAAIAPSRTRSRR